MPTFSLRMLSKHRTLYDAITGHRLVSGMADATLPVPVFRSYIIQDYLYLKSFAGFLQVLASRSPQDKERKMFQRHLRDSAAAEVALHESFFPRLSISAATLAVAIPLPGYAQNTKILRETYLSAPLPDAMAAIIPCYRAYLEMGRKVASRQPVNLLYAQWAGLYSCPDYERAVAEIEQAADGCATEQTEPGMEAAYIRSCRLESGFLDAICESEDTMEEWK